MEKKNSTELLLQNITKLSLVEMDRQGKARFSKNAVKVVFVQ